MTIHDMTKYVNKFLHVCDMTKLQYSILLKKKKNCSTDLN